MVEAGLTDTSALKMVGMSVPLIGSITRDKALLSILLFLRACWTLAGSTVLVGTALAGRVTGSSRVARARRRSVFTRGLETRRDDMLEMFPLQFGKCRALCPNCGAKAPSAARVAQTVGQGRG